MTLQCQIEVGATSNIRKSKLHVFTLETIRNLHRILLCTGFHKEHLFTNYMDKAVAVLIFEGTRQMLRLVTEGTAESISPAVKSSQFRGEDCCKCNT
jgi:hypothetical protein